MSRLTIGRVLAMAGLAALGACGSSDAGPGPNLAALPDQTTFQVTWNPATKVLAEADAKGKLVGTDPKAGTYTFQPDATAVAALQAGDVAVLSGVALVRVVSVDSTGGPVVLTATRAALTDAIDTGTVAWDVGFDFARPDRFLNVDIGDGTYTGALTRDPVGRVTSALTGAISYSGTLGGYDVSLKVSPDAVDGADIAFTASRKGAGNSTFALKGTGTLRGFRVTGGVDLELGTLKELNFATTDLEGDLTIEFGGVELGTGDDAFAVPAKLILPFPLGPIPAYATLGGVLEISSTLVAQTTAIAKAHIQFKGSIGVQSDGKSFTPVGSLDSSSLDFESGQSVATIDAGLGVLFHFPRVEVGLGVPGTGIDIYATAKNEVVANTTVKFEAAGPYPVITGTCMEVDVNLGAYVGGEMKIFGIKLAAKETPIFTKLMPPHFEGKSCQ